MRIKSFINQMKEPIYKDDLAKVITNGLIYALLYGMLAGAIQYATETFLGLTFSVFVFLIAFMIAKKINDSFFSFHLVYPIIAIGCFVFGYFIYGFVKYLFILRDISATVKIFFSAVGMKSLWGFVVLFQGNVLNNIFDLLIFLIAIISCWQIVYRRK